MKQIHLCHYVFSVHWTGTTGAPAHKVCLCLYVSMPLCVIACSVKLVATDFLFFSISQAAPAPRPQLFHRLHFRSKWPSRSKSLLLWRAVAFFPSSRLYYTVSLLNCHDHFYCLCIGTSETELKLLAHKRRYYYSFLFLLLSPSCEPRADRLR